MTVGYRQNIIEAKDITLRIYDKTVEKKTTTKLLVVYIDGLCLGKIRYPTT